MRRRRRRLRQQGGRAVTSAGRARSARGDGGAGASEDDPLHRTKASSGSGYIRKCYIGDYHMPRVAGATWRCRKHGETQAGVTRAATTTRSGGPQPAQAARRNHRPETLSGGALGRPELDEGPNATTTAPSARASEDDGGPLPGPAAATSSRDGVHDANAPAPAPRRRCRHVC